MATATDTAGGPATPALAGDLKKLVLDLMIRRLERMFEGADGLLMEMAEKTRNPADQRRNFETKTLVRANRKAITQVFADQLTASFLPGAEKKKKSSSDVSFDELQLSKTRTIDESIAVNNIALKVENTNEQPLYEIGRRLDWLIHERNAPISPAALAPSTLCDAFRVSTQSLNLEFQTELLIYKLFDKLVVPSLNEVYAEALKLLDTGGVTAVVLKNSGRNYAPPKSAGAPSRPAIGGAGPSGSGGGPQPGGITRGFATTPGAGGAAVPAGASTGHWSPAGNPGAGTGAMQALDSRTLDSLRMAQGGSAGVAVNYSDADLATELSQAASGHAVAGWGAPQARANLQCADLVGKMFNGIIEDSSVPPDLKPKLDDLRFAVIKSAMSDRSFFANADHPIRKLINELATMAASARATGAGSVGQLGDLVAMIQSQFQVAAKSVKAAAATAVPLTDADAERFLDDQLVQGKARRQALIDKARKVVNEEMQLRLMGRSIPEQARPVLYTGLAPLLGLRLLRKGMDSEEWREGAQLLQRVIDAVAPEPGSAPDAIQIDPLCTQIERQLSEVGMASARTGELLVGLRQGFELVERQRQADPTTMETPKASAQPAAAASPAERPTDLLLRLLVPGEWFKVHDAEAKQTRWLKVSAQHLDDERPDYRGRVAFAEFSGKNTLLVKVEDLLEHVAAGLTEPFDQSPRARAALAALKQQHAGTAAAAP